MLTAVDLLTFAILIFAIWDGWRAGLFRAALNPLCFFFFIPISVINFDLNRNIVVASLIAIVGTFVLSSLIRLILFFSRRGLDKDFRLYVFWGSRLAGSVISVYWKQTVYFVIILLISLIPTTFVPGMNSVQQDIMFSQTYAYINTHVFPKFPKLQNIYLTLSVFKDPYQVKQLSDSREFSAFFKSEKVQALVNDEGVKAFLAGGNLMQLLAHPRVKAVITDDKLMATLAELSRNIYEEKFRKDTK